MTDQNILELVRRSKDNEWLRVGSESCIHCYNGNKYIILCGYGYGVEGSKKLRVRIDNKDTEETIVYKDFLEDENIYSSLYELYSSYGPI